MRPRESSLRIGAHPGGDIGTASSCSPIGICIRLAPLLKQLWGSFPGGVSEVFPTSMVSVAQLVERWIVAPVVVGSIPITHPTL
jgi:hypothetical protein